MPEKPSAEMLHHCLAEVGRLANQDFAKADEQIFEDLAQRLAECADSQGHATEMITAWKRSTRRMLHESDLPALADLTANRGTLPKGCARCHGTDFIVIERGEYTAAGRCGCLRGSLLAKMDSERLKHQQQRDQQPRVEVPEREDIRNVNPEDFGPWKQ
jgi:hypothetical protein